MCLVEMKAGHRGRPRALVGQPRKKYLSHMLTTRYTEQRKAAMTGLESANMLARRQRVAHVLVKVASLLQVRRWHASDRCVDGVCRILWSCCGDENRS
jgi:hypothetical protein